MSYLIFTTSFSSTPPAFPGARWRAGCQGSPGEPVVLRAPAGPPRKWPNNCARPLLHPAIFHPCCPFSSHISWSQGLYPPSPKPLSASPRFMESSLLTSIQHFSNFWLLWASSTCLFVFLCLLTRRFSDSSVFSSFPSDALQGLAKA